MPSCIQPLPPSAAANTKPTPRANAAAGEKPCGQAFLETLANARQQKPRSDAKPAESDVRARRAEAPAAKKATKVKKPRKREESASAAAGVESDPVVDETPTTEKPVAAEATEVALDAEEADVTPKGEATETKPAVDGVNPSVTAAAQAAAAADAAVQPTGDATAAPGEADDAIAASAVSAIDVPALAEGEMETSPASSAAPAQGAKAFPRQPRGPRAGPDAIAGEDGSQAKQQGAGDAEPAAAAAPVAAGFAEDAASVGGELTASESAKPHAAAPSAAGGASSLTPAQPGDAQRAGDVSKHVATAPPPPPAPTPERFAELNHARIVTATRAELLPNGGTMHIKLDPPELGALQVSVRMVDGAVTASFQTSSDEATRLLSHSLAQLKHVLESQGVTVDKIHVQQAPRDQQASNDDQRHQQQNQPWDQSARHEQQRKEMLRRMWRRLSIGSDPLDLVA
jgi:flagellar hook-length control protein FliK